MRTTLLRRALAGGAVVLAAAPAAAQSVIAGNFGPGGSYLTGSANSWLNGFNAPGNQASENAVAFTVGATGAAALTQFRFAANYFGGSNDLTADLLAGADLNTATRLERFLFTAPSAPYFEGVFTATSVLQPVLMPGQTYWIRLGHGDPQTPTDAVWGWQRNALGQVGFSSRFTQYGAGAPQVGQWFTQPTATTPVFDVTARAVAAVVPEPSTYALLAAGLGGVGLIARRRRSV